MSGLTVLKDMGPCTGCGACADACRCEAIGLVADEDGFRYPTIDPAKCIGCNACRQVCPVLVRAAGEGRSGREEKTCLAVQAQDSVRDACTSGGVAYVLAKRAVELGWFVAGCVMDRDMTARMIVSDDPADIAAMRGSKYVQGDSEGLYRRVEELLSQDKGVLFFGLPCQVSAMRNHARNLTKGRLVLVDLLCHGVSNDRLFKRDLRENHPGPVRGFEFRDKTHGWSWNLRARVERAGGATLVDWNDEPYCSAFLKSLSLRPSCYTCPFASEDRASDLTLGDFWGVAALDTRFDDARGTSLVVVNTHVGREFLDGARSQFARVEKENLSDAVRFNTVLRFPAYRHPGREAFFASLRTGSSIREAIRAGLNYRYDCAILNFWNGNGIGAVLTAFALQRYLQERGRISILVDDRLPGSPERIEDCPSARFARKRLRTTPPCRSVADLEALNDHVDVFMTGSDQVWRNAYAKPYLYLDFVRRSKPKIAVSVSFGLDHFEEGGHLTLAQARKFASRFTAVSVREDSGVKICEETLGCPAVHVIDPVFAVDPETYERLSDESELQSGDFVACYVLDAAPQKDAAARTCAEHYGCGRREAARGSVEDWLWTLRHAKCVVTDSFHGVCFSLIFHRPFVCCTTDGRGNERIYSLMRQFGVDPKDVMWTGPAEFDFGRLDWEAFYLRFERDVSRERVRFGDWIGRALETRGPGPEESRELIDRMERELTDSQERREELGRKYSELCAMVTSGEFGRLWRYRLLSKLTFGRKRRKYREKCEKIQERLRMALADMGQVRPER